MADENTALARSQPHYLDEDFDTIHEAVLETARGRWFLQEYARRNRSADTGMLLAALARIEAAMGVGEASREPALLPDLQLLELRDAIALTRDNLGAVGARDRAIRNADFANVSAALGNVAARLRATFERLQETAWTLRDRDGANPLCDSLETQARDIARICTLLDEIGGGAAAMVALLNEVEDRVGAMIAQAGPRQAPVPSRAHPQNEYTASAADRPEPASRLEAEHDEAAGTVILAFDPDYERIMSEAVDAALLSEHEGARWHLPAEADDVAVPEAFVAETLPAEGAAPVPDAEAAGEPDLSDRSFEALAEAAPQGRAPAAEPSPQPDAATMAWIDTLAPKVRAAEPATPQLFEEIAFPLASGEAVISETGAPKSLPNIAALERDRDAPPASLADSVASAVQDEIAAAMADIRNAVQAKLAQEVQPHLSVFAEETSEPAANIASAAPPPAQAANPLGPIMALSDEEKIALFS